MVVTMEVYHAERSARKTATEASILGWLLVYPASSAQECAAALLIHSSTVYRALARLVGGGLVQGLSGYGSEARFLLTRAGITAIAQVMQYDPLLLARRWQHGKSAPARLVPRLVTIDRLHAFARMFFQYAPAQLARQGHAAVVRWHIVRDWRADVFQDERYSMVARAEAVLAWTIEDSREYGLSAWAQASGPPCASRWEAAFVLLESGLCDHNLIAKRLLRLLRLRESLERRDLSASMFPPVLILVENERQVEVWRRVAREVARNARYDGLAGAIVTLGEQENPWQWGWRDLATGASIRLAGLFVPLPQAALPPGVMTHISSVQAVLRTCASTGTGAKPSISMTPATYSKPAKLPQVLTPRARELLTLLARTPQMAAEEIAAVLRREPDEGPLSEATAERLLRELARQGLVERELVAQGSSARWRWHLSELGLRKVAAIHDVSIPHLSRRVQHGEQTVLEPRDRFVLLRQGAHLAGVYGVVAVFHRSAQATKGRVTVAWWGAGRGCARTYLYHGVQRNLRPDAELELVQRHAGDSGSSLRRLRLWLEYDSGTMNRRDLDRKMGAYADYWASKEWVAEGLATLPRLLFIVPDGGQERRVREACVEQLAGTRMRVLVSTAAHLEAETPFGDIWRQILPVLPDQEQTRRRGLWE